MNEETQLNSEVNCISLTWQTSPEETPRQIRLTAGMIVPL